MSVGIWASIRAKLSAFVGPLISRTQSTGRVRVLAKPSNKLPVGMSARRLNALASEMRVCENYLEVGVAQGLTLEQIKVLHRWGVDPTPQFNTDKLPKGLKFYSQDSDSFFNELQASQKFNLVFLVGLHQWQQTYRDLINVLCHSDKETIIVIDDVVPDDELAAFPDWDQALLMKDAAGITDGRWQGDVFKVILAIAQGHPELGFCTVTTHKPDDNPQAIVWIKDKSVTTFTSELLPQLEKQFADVTYSDVFVGGSVPEIFGLVDEQRGISIAIEGSHSRL